MEQKLKNFKIKLNKKIPVDEFLEKALYEPNIGIMRLSILFFKALELT